MDSSPLASTLTHACLKPGQNPTSPSRASFDAPKMLRVIHAEEGESERKKEREREIEQERKSAKAHRGGGTRDTLTESHKNGFLGKVSSK